MMTEWSEEFFYYSLAETLGYTVHDLLNSLTSLELTRWQAFFKVQNFKYQQAATARKTRAQLKGRRV